MKEQYLLFDVIYPELVGDGPASSTTPHIVELRIEDVLPSPLNPRKTINPGELAALASSIKERGVLSPIKVCRAGDHYEIVAGERRWRAAKIAGLTEIPAIIIAGDVDPEEHVAQALIENLLRSDLSPMDEARGYQALIDAGMQQTEVARQVGRSPSSVSNLRRLLELPSEVIAMIESEKLSASHGIALAGLADQPGIALHFAHEAIADDVSSKALEQAVALYKNDRAAAAKVPPLVTALVDKLSAPKEASGSGATPTGDIDPTELCPITYARCERSCHYEDPCEIMEDWQPTEDTVEQESSLRKWTIVDPENYYYPDESGGWIIAEDAVGHCSANNADDIWYMPDPFTPGIATIREGATGTILINCRDTPGEIARSIEEMDASGGISRWVALARRGHPISPRYQAPDPAPPQLGDVLHVVEPPQQEDNFRAETGIAPPDEASRWRDLYNEQLARAEELDARYRIATDAVEHHKGVAKSLGAALKVANEQMEALRGRPLATVLSEAIKELPANTPGEFIAVLAECSSWLEDTETYERGPLTSAMEAAQAIMDDFAIKRDVLTEQEHEIWSDLRGGASPLYAAGILEILAVKRLRWLRDEGEVPCP